MKFGILLIGLILAAASLSQENRQPLVYVKHLEPPLRYPPIARVAQVQGAVGVKLTIAANGKVLAIDAIPEEEQTVGYPLLKRETEKVVKNWTFGCANCPPNVPYEQSMKFIYRLDGERSSQDETRVVMELPDQVIISARPAECDHCPPKKK